MTRARIVLACALLGVLRIAAAEEAPASVQQLQMTCRMAKNVPDGTKVRVSMRAKLTHLAEPKDGETIGDAVEVWAKETLVWEAAVPKGGGVPAHPFAFTFDQAFPPPPPGAVEAIVFTAEWKVEHPAPVKGSKEESGTITFAVPKPAKPSEWNHSLTVRKDRNGEGELELALFPPSGLGPGGGNVLRPLERK